MIDLTDADLHRLVEVFTTVNIRLLHVRTDDVEIVLSRDPGSADAAPRSRLPPSSAARADDSESGGVGRAPAGERDVPGGSAYPTATDSQGDVGGGHAPASVSRPPSTGDTTGTWVTAPAVGIFYRAPEPGAPPFVDPGDRVEEDSTVGLVEAMKVFTAVTAGVSGSVAEIVAADEQFVEYGQNLLRIVSDSPDL